MSIQDTIKKLQATNIPADLLIQVTNLIRAGQALRDWPCTPDKSWDDVSKAWDAALGGEDEQAT